MPEPTVTVRMKEDHAAAAACGVAALAFALERPFHFALERFMNPTVTFSDNTLADTAAAERVAQAGVAGRADRTQLEAIGLELFEGLWRMDFIAVDLSRTSGS